MPKYTIETDRTLLRPPTKADLYDWATHFFADPDVMRHMPKRDMTPLQLAERALNNSERNWADYGYGGWVIRDKPNDKIIGRCGLSYLAETGETDIGFGLIKTYWGQGVATEVARACVRFGFEIAGLNEIIGVVVPENVASWRVLERIGFEFKKKATYYDLDVVYYTIKPDQFDYGDGFYQAELMVDF